VATRARVDELDLRIVRELLLGEQDYFRPDRVTIDHVAARLGVHRNTVSERVRRLAAAGFYLPLGLEVEPSSVGLTGGLAFFPVPPERRTPATRDAVFQLEGVQFLLRFVEGWGISLHAEDEASLASKVAVLQALTGSGPPEWDIRSADFGLAEPARLRPLDVRILGALLGDARRSFRSVARAVGAAPKTAERRVQRLQRDGVLTMLPGGGGFELEGMAMLFVMVHLRPGERRDRAVGEVLARFPDQLIRIVPPAGPVHVNAYARSLGELQDQVDSVRRLACVARVTARIMLGYDQSPRFQGWLLRVLARRVG
jgi:DNA-binding Lrp family transcriptional regulator